MNLKAKCLLSSSFIIILLFLLYIRQYEIAFTVNRKEYGQLKNEQPQQQQEEKFMTYLPHSGLHNQRISLVNALVVAKILNRTLLLPEMNIGTAVVWRPATDLAQQIEECPPIVVEEKLKNVINETAKYPCRYYREYTAVPVESIFDLTAAHEKFGVRTEQRISMRRDYWRKHNLSRSSFNIIGSEEEVATTTSGETSLGYNNSPLLYTVHDKTRYAYQLYEGAFNKTNLDSKFDSYISLDSLKDRSELYLEFGSLFGQGRVGLQSRAFVQMRDDLHRETRLNHPIVNDISQEISNLLSNNYTSLHLRQGDGGFKAAVSETLQKIETDLQHYLEVQQSQQTKAMTKEEEYLVIQSLFSQQKSRSVLHKLDVCLSIQTLNILNLELIYLATDAKNSREQFKDLYDKYPCLFTLNDFPEILEEARQKQRDSTTTDIAVDLLIPMIDAEIASKAKYFIGTPASTFSAYINNRNKYYKSIQ